MTTKIIKTRTTTTNFTLDETFEFLGNEGNAKVYKQNNSWGDGDIDTGHGGKVIVSITANMTQINNNNLRLTITYKVWESSYYNTSDKNIDSLYFTATKDIDIKRFNKNTVTKKDNSTITTTETPKLIDCSEAYYTDYYHTKKSRHDWYPIDPTSELEPAWYGGQTPSRKPQSWIPLKNPKNDDVLFVKIDDGGSELKEVGYIGIKGVLSIPMQIIKEETTVTES